MLTLSKGRYDSIPRGRRGGSSSLAADNRGFTLIEVLVALAIMSVVLVAIYGTFFLSHRAMEGMDESIIKLQECRMAMDTIRREIDSSLFSEGNKNSVFKVEDRDVFGKQASRFMLTAFSPLRPGLSLISYFVEEKDGKPALYKKINSSYPAGNPAGSEKKGEELIDDIEAFAVEVKNDSGWVKVWDARDAKKVPEELRITITVLLKDRRFSIYETIRPKIGRSL